jgi:hypothetical protein
MATIEHVMRLRSKRDRPRAEIGAAIGCAGPNRWLTPIFTGDTAQP